MDQAIVKRYEQAIYQSLQTMDPGFRPAELEKMRQQIADEVGTPEWREATRQAIAKFEAKSS